MKCSKFLFLASMLAFSAHGGLLDELKSTPATKYEVGKLKLEIISVIAEQNMKGEEVKGTKFDFYGFDVFERDNTLGFKVQFVGRSKYLTQDQCDLLHSRTLQVFSSEKLAKEVWPELDEKSHQELAKDLTVVTEFVDKDNNQLTKTCGI